MMSLGISMFNSISVKLNRGKHPACLKNGLLCCQKIKTELNFTHFCYMNMLNTLSIRNTDLISIKPCPEIRATFHRKTHSSRSFCFLESLLWFIFCRRTFIYIFYVYCPPDSCNFSFEFCKFVDHKLPADFFLSLSFVFMHIWFPTVIYSLNSIDFSKKFII